MLRTSLTYSLAGIFLVAVGLCAVFVPWQWMLVVFPALLLLAIGMLERRFALCLLIATAWFLQGEVAARMFHLRMSVALFADPVTIDFPFLPAIVGGLIVFVYLFLDRKAAGPGVSFHDSPIPPLLVLLGYSVVALAWAANMNWAVPWLFLFAVNVGTFLVFVKIVRSLDDLWVVLRWTVLLGGIHAVVVCIWSFCAEKVWNVPLTDSLSLYLQMGGGHLSRSLFLRTGSLGPFTVVIDRHILGHVCNILAGMCLGLFMVEKTRLKRMVLLPLLLLLAFLTIETGTRSAFVGLSAMCAFLLLTLKTLRRRLVFWVPVFVLTVMGLMELGLTIDAGVTGTQEYSRVIQTFFPSSNTEDFGKGAEFGASDSLVAAPSARAYLWSAGWRMFTETSGLGGGVESVRLPSIPWWIDYVHSLYLSVIQDYGIVGILVLVWMGYVLWARMIRLFKCAESDAKVLAIALCGGLVAIAAGGLSDFVYNDPMLWPILGLTVAACNIAIAEDASRCA